MIFGNGLKKFDFARQNLDGREKCLAQKMRKKHRNKAAHLDAGVRAEVEAEVLVEEDVRVDGGAGVDVLGLAAAVAGRRREEARVVALLDHDERDLGLEVGGDLLARLADAAQLVLQHLAGGGFTFSVTTKSSHPPSGTRRPTRRRGRPRRAWGASAGSGRRPPGALPAAPPAAPRARAAAFGAARLKTGQHTRKNKDPLENQTSFLIT